MTNVFAASYGVSLQLTALQCSWYATNLYVPISRLQTNAIARATVHEQECFVVVIVG